ncbi:hypothetical protein F0L74_09815 [Chitinophaga agrisoli]|uniref:Uncharacterized protein n=1 Tax=Chitinophaga agrisoli TaxID=2607653 RepID=A0A5B2VUR4_9BACT|nr:hypothetical protein [Chitinophaga agrisoli]KAA2242815.1 hypothetical protein F0L74_09815 [Chitinophaga agrisoli]
MAGIKQPIQDLMNRLREIPELQYVRVWNNQIQSRKQGQHYDYPTPAAFVEVINSPVWEEIGMGFQGADLGVTIHLEHEYYDAQDGTFEQDLIVFDLRDKIVAKLSLYEATACGPLVKTGESQSYDHDNVYEYTIDFACHFIDSKGSPYDPDAGKFIDKTPPTGLQVVVNEVNSIVGRENTPIHDITFKIPQ